MVVKMVPGEKNLEYFPLFVPYLYKIETMVKIITRNNSSSSKLQP